MKDKIIESSIRLFERRGFAETSIQDIVETLGVTKGTFYYYFSSKEELLMDIHLSYIDGLIARQEEILRDSSAAASTKIHRIISLLIHDIQCQGQSAKVFFREMKALSEDKLSQIVPKRDLFRLNMEQVVKEGIENGELRPELDPAIVTFGILGMANWCYQWFQPGGRLTEEDVSEMFVDMLLTGIAVK
ncbi:TetR family transcriptional regulator [Bacillus sp. FJAT-27916]|uniref:TetR/AcrR family transcriptional regulator n=1 Tax=Bacillaceae TaxID=186817 RepID=UPI0006716FB5|nr:TetR/AcrR family transcriptional regulator [Bacillus sp. FJAT-27916]KMY45674.1 TetR family transcriptional regulator [Bacillus sp. FJAT-27916]